MFGQSKSTSIKVSERAEDFGRFRSLEATLSLQIEQMIREAGAAQAKAEAELARERTHNARAERRERMARMRRKVVR